MVWFGLVGHASKRVEIGREKRCVIIHAALKALVSVLFRRVGSQRNDREPLLTRICHRKVDEMEEWTQQEKLSEEVDLISPTP